MTTLCPARVRRLLTTAAMLLALGGAVACSEIPVQTSAQALPLDVRDFVMQQNKCDDWRRAVAAGDPRREQLGKDIVAICGKKHTELARLKTKYADDPQVLYSLQYYEEE
jgi:hypothetical protein